MKHIIRVFIIPILGLLCGIAIAQLWILRFYIFAILPILIFLMLPLIEYLYNVANINNPIFILMRILYDALNFDRIQDVRLTLLIPSYLGKCFIQRIRITDRGSERTYGLWKIGINQGVAGKCFKSRSIVKFIVEGNFVESMISSLGFSEKQAIKFVRDRRSYLCVPIMRNNKVLGILSFDSNSKTTFSDDKVELIENFTKYFSQLLGD